MRDSIRNSNNRTAAIRAQFKYDYEKKIRDEKIAKELKEAEDARTRNIIYALIALGILVFIVLFLLVSHTIVATPKMIQFFGVITLLIVFEFINLLMHPFLHEITQHSTFLMLLAMVCLANAKRTIEELEEPTRTEDTNQDPV